MSNERIHLELSLDEINLILESLGELPFRRVFQVIGHIQASARAQIPIEEEEGLAANGHRLEDPQAGEIAEEVRR